MRFVSWIRNCMMGLLRWLTGMSSPGWN